MQLEPPPLPPTPEIEIVDGDTFKMNGERYRLAGVDTPERRGKCLAERYLAYQAMTYLYWQLTRNDVRFEYGKKDRYQRILVTVKVGEANVADWMVDKNLAVKWTGKRQNWCE